jgi:hypothetical protein
MVLQLSQSGSVLEQAAQAVIHGSSQRPSAESLVEALLQAETVTKRTKITYPSEQLLGTWRLCFITGTHKTKQRAGIVLGAGRYVPNWVKIQLGYEPLAVPLPSTPPLFEAGRIANQVQLGPLQLSLTGPTKFMAPKRILAFDFTTLAVRLFGGSLYNGSVRGGTVAEERFYSENTNQQAFFAYFWASELAIAARGRGGGLALWGRIS